MNFEQYTAEANRFLNEISAELNGPQDGQSAYRITRGVLHAIRELLTPEESTHLIAQLPMMLKAVYVDGWKIKPEKRIRSMPEFLECLRKKSAVPGVDFGNDQESVQKVQIVLAALQRRVSQGEMADVFAQFPSELMELWRTPAENRVE